MLMKRLRIGDSGSSGSRLNDTTTHDASSLLESVEAGVLLSPSKLLFRRGQGRGRGPSASAAQPQQNTNPPRHRLFFSCSSSSFFVSPRLLVIFAASVMASTALIQGSRFVTSSSSSFSSFRPLSAQKLLSQPMDDLLNNNKCTVHKLDPELLLVKSPNTVVTAYFRVKSKHSASSYDGWMSNMLSIQDPVVVFTQSDMVDKVKKLREHAKNRTVIIESDYHDLPLAQLGHDFWQHQLDIDPEKARHQSYQLFWIWLSKSWWTVQAIRQNYFESNFFMWADIGSFRHGKFNNKRIIQHPDMVPTGTLLWLAHHPPKPPPPPQHKLFHDKIHFKQHFYHSGSQAAGTASAWLDFHRKFSLVLDQFVQQHLFVGEDQCVLQSTCLQFPTHCAYVPFDQVHDNHYFGLRYVLHHGPSSAKNTVDQRYRLWRPPGWKNETATATKI